MLRNYVPIETLALLQRRLGMTAVHAFETDFVPALRVEWIDRDAHRAGMVALLTASRRQLSLVDCVSFDMMRRLAINTAFTFDTDFSGQGFRTVP